MRKMYCIVSIHLYSASCSTHKSEALPVRETRRDVAASMVDIVVAMVDVVVSMVDIVVGRVDVVVGMVNCHLVQWK